jgi:hypothetical protein
MVVVYLKNGEKAPMPDANYVKVDAAADSNGEPMLRCYFGNVEVGQFKWNEIAGYTVESIRAPNGSPDPWTQRLQP